MEHIWLLSGYAGSGKDTAATLLESLLVSVTRLSFAGMVKDEVAAKYAIPREWMDTQEGKAQLLHLPTRSIRVRDLLIEHAEGEKERTGNPAIWASRIHATTTHCILSDWRFPEEYEDLRRRFPAAKLHTLRVHRPSVSPLSTYTEHALDSFPFDVVLRNDGSLLQLAQQIQSILERFEIPVLGL